MRSSPRRRRRHLPLINPVEMAMHRAARLSPDQRRDLLGPADQCIELLCSGAGSVDVWRQVADAFNLAEALAELGIARNLRDALRVSQLAMARISDKVRADLGWLVDEDAAHALRNGLWIYSVQLEHCSAGEHLRAIELVRNRVSAALAGNAGRGVQVHDLVDQEAGHG